MARIYAGELSRVEKDVVERLREELPEDFTVLAEVNIGRNVDLVIIRPNGDNPALLIAAELKHVSRPLMGQTDGVWKELNDEGDWQDVEPSNSRDINYYWQSVHAGNALKDWLWRNQRLYRDEGVEIEGGRFSAWPDLVLIGDPAVPHRLPIAPTSRYGQWYFGVDAWLRHLLTWNPRKGVPFNQREVDRLIEVMGLVELPGVEGRLPLADPPQHDLTSVVRDLGERVLILESWLTDTARPAAAIARPKYELAGAAQAS